MNHNTLKPNPHINDYGIDDDQLEYRTEFTETESGLHVASAKQRQDRRECPCCHRSDAVVVHDHYAQKIRVRMPSGAPGVIVVEKPKFFCRRCHHYFTVPLTGVALGESISEMEKSLIKKEFLEKKSFALIAKEHHIDPSYALRLFDKLYPSVPRLRLPKALCIDEILFCSTADAKYPALLYDFETREIVDVIRSRQKPYLEDYFSKIPEGERKNVKFFISDMYDTYHRVAKKYFPDATYVVDLFHVIKQLTDAVSKLRANLMNSLPKDSFEYGFMKSRWKCFTVRKCEISRSYYTNRAEGVSMCCFDAVMLCLNKSPKLWDGWSILQDLYNWDRYDTFTEAQRFIEFTAKRLLETSSDLLRSVGRTYWKWRVEIANGLVRYADGIRYHNCVAEGRNRDAKDIKDFSKGCVDFFRYRKRIMLVINRHRDDE